MSAEGSEERRGVESLKNFERALGHVRNSVRPLTLMSREEVGACVTPADRAKLNLQMAYGVSSLFYMFLKTQGISPSDHPVKKELERIREYFGRLKEVGKPPAQRKLKVNTEASRRFIESALSSDSVWKNAKSTDSKAAQEQRASAGIGRSTPAGQPENAMASSSSSWTSVKRKGHGSGGSGISGKRKHAADEGVAADTLAEDRTGSGGGSSGGDGGVDETKEETAPETAGAAQARTAPQADSTPKAKKAKSGGKKGGKKSPRYRTW